MRSSFLGTSLAALSFAACSSAAGTAGFPADDGGSSAVTDSGGGGAEGATQGGVDSGGGTADAGDAGTGAEGGGGSSGGPTARLFPLAVGYAWTYDVQPVGGGSVCAPGTQVQSVTGTRFVDGRNAFDLQSFCAAAGTSEVAPAATGDEVDLDYQGSWLEMIDPNLVEGETWSYFNSSYTWHRETSVTVPAGTYADCWTAKQNVSYTAYLTYCRGVGLVRSYSSDLTGSGWDAQLAKKSF